jgi:Outer membrane protein beta-barrel domain
MKRCVVDATMSLVAILCLDASIARAQAPAAAATSAETKASLSVSGGPTLGHKSAGFVAIEGDWRLTDRIDVFVEGGHMGNVGTSALEANATLIANAIGAQVGSTAIKVNHVDFGIRFNLVPPRPKIHPYVVLGVGVARATTEVTFTNASGTVIDPSGSVTLGGDLSGSNTKTLLIFGGGIVYPLARNYFADVGYRFGGILSKVSDIENDQTIKTQRIMLGAGVRF